MGVTDNRINLREVQGNYLLVIMKNPSTSL